MRYFFGAGKRRSYFEGWYFKQQNGRETVCLIPAFHIDGAGRASASLQVITDTQSYWAEFPAQAFEADAGSFSVRIGDSVFSEGGCILNLKTDAVTLTGQLRYGPFQAPAGDIMGPFRFVPLMECRHSVLSLCHPVSGTIEVNGHLAVFENGCGYVEGDRGTSFPRRYLWTQCLHEGSSVMLSVAQVPFWKGTFTGCIGFVFADGKERRIATYRGARVIRAGDGLLLLRQGELAVRAELLGGRFHPLRAPVSGGMTDTIHESAACRVRYTCTVKNRTVLDFVSEQASFEDHWTKSPGK